VILSLHLPQCHCISEERNENEKFCFECELIPYFVVDVPECKVWRNPLNLFRGAEYQRFYWATNKEPLTYYDMNLSAQDHQTFFTCEGDCGKAEYESEYHSYSSRKVCCFCPQHKLLYYISLHSLDP
jgi:hypothetical protein